MGKGCRLLVAMIALEIAVIAVCITQTVILYEEIHPEAEMEAVTSERYTDEPELYSEEVWKVPDTSVVQAAYQGIEKGDLSGEPAVRIRLTTSDYSSEYHDKLVVTCNGVLWLETGDKAQIYTGGQTITIDESHPFFREGCIRVSAQEGILQIDSITHRNQVNTYPGVLELYQTDQGIVIVNELELEEYVKRVVPSEMPASYGAEAARLQAVCARTYAYQKLFSGQTDSYGAIANDSTDYQVYNASLPKDVSSMAAEETRGIVMMYQGSPLVPYYFSTSCGFNTDNTVWSGSALPYLRAQNLSYSGQLDLQSEEIFRSFILNWDYPAYEDDCTWYRWNYTIALENLKKVLPGRMMQLMSERPECFRAVRTDGTEIAADPGMLHEVKEIKVTSRLKGGMVGEVALVCEQSVVFVSGEMVLRRLFGCPERVYCNQSSEGIGESEGDYLPSAFFCLVESEDENGRMGYSICGGGNGHGIGLSQNAANAMLQAGLSWREVLQFFYLGTSLVQLY